MNKQDFPALNQDVYGKPLVYFDNAATTQKPQVVIDAVSRFYENDNSNVHRGVHALSARADKAYEAARDSIKNFINAKSRKEIIFVRGSTEGINLLSGFIKAGDEVIISGMEHHANIVPWQLAGAKLNVIPVLDNGELDLNAYKNLLNSNIKLVSITHMSNTLGTINPVKEMIALAHDKNILVLLDCAQSISHGPIDVQDLDCDFLVFSGHKIYGPTGIGAVYGKQELLDKIPPYQGGGAMIEQVSFEKTTFNQLPFKFEAGTPNIAGAIGLAAALDYLNQFSWSDIIAYEKNLLDYAQEKIQSVPGLRIIGTAENKGAIISFVMDKAHPHDIATILDRAGIAIRAGHHCTMPLMKRFNVPATARISMAFYNTTDEIDLCIDALHEVKRIFS
ncbi:MAG: SufS family cysteine desulfurase [Legionellales bacterium]|jgi:cysteine desulfurase/selenocysteine lyase